MMWSASFHRTQRTRVPFSCSRLASRGSANHSSVDSRIVGASETGFEQINCDFLEADFGDNRLEMTSTSGLAGNASTGHREEISVVNPAPAGGSSQFCLSLLACVLLPHHAAASGDQ